MYKRGYKTDVLMSLTKLHLFSDIGMLNVREKVDSPLDIPQTT